MQTEFKEIVKRWPTSQYGFKKKGWYSQESCDLFPMCTTFLSRSKTLVLLLSEFDYHPMTVIVVAVQIETYIIIPGRMDMSNTAFAQSGNPSHSTAMLGTFGTNVKCSGRNLLKEKKIQGQSYLKIQEGYNKYTQKWQKPRVKTQNKILWLYLPTSALFFMWDGNNIDYAVNVDSKR